MKRLNKRLLIPSAIVTGVVVLLILLVHFTGSNPVTNVIKTVFSPFQQGASYVTGKINEVTSFLWEAQGYKAESERLEAELNEAQRKGGDAEKYREENERLRELLDLKESMNGYETVAASVIAYSANNWYDTIEINRGAADGVKVGASVISGDGAVGRVVSVGSNWSMVSSIINTGSVTGITVSRTGDIGVVEGDGELCMKGLCRVTFIENDGSLVVGDLLETSGSGGVFPRGCIVGRVTDVKSDTTGHLSEALVKPSVNFSKLREVLVVKQ